MGDEKGKDVQTGPEEPCLAPGSGPSGSSLRKSHHQCSTLASAHPLRLGSGQAAPTAHAGHAVGSLPSQTGFVRLVL